MECAANDGRRELRCHQPFVACASTTTKSFMCVELNHHLDDFDDALCYDAGLCHYSNLLTTAPSTMLVEPLY